MKKAYDEIMEHIAVTSEMRRRILRRVQEEDLSPAPGGIPRFPSLRTYLSVAACFIVLLAGAIALPRLLDRGKPEPPVLAVPNITEAASTEELSGLVGFAVTTDFSLPFEAEEVACRAYWNELAQIEYSGGGSSATYRQSLGTDDNSGDYNVYGDTAEITANGLQITLKGNNGSYGLAVWTDGTYSYSLSLSPGASAEAWRAILRLGPDCRAAR